jgi:Mce-associated membrane protein
MMTLSKGTTAVPRETETTVRQHDTEPASAEPADDPAAMLMDTDELDDGAQPEKASDSDDPDIGREPGAKRQAKHRLPIDRPKIFAYVVLPTLALLLAAAAGYLAWQTSTAHRSEIARVESTAAAKDTTIALLSYKPDTVEKDLAAARDRLTGTFKDSYTQLTHDVVIPGAKQKHIAAVATVPAAAAVHATPNHAVVLLYVNQTTTIGTDAPSDSVSVVRVTLDNVNGRWLVSEFDPV